VELAISMSDGVTTFLGFVFFIASTVFIYRSFYGMRISSKH
jgi:hypothetical protein